METIGSWFRKQASTLIVLFVIFGLALFLRAYFPLGESVQEHLLSGGSDSFYWERIIREIVTTGHHLDWDPLLNYPMGLGNPRPPLFSWSVAVPGMVLSPLVGDMWQSVIDVLILSTAIWGALTVFPTFFLTKDIFGRRAGLIAAFLLAVLPAHLQRSQATDADHDSMALFFVVTIFFFFMKALRALNERRWVASWDARTREGRSSIVSGIGGFFKENRKAVLYSAMSGLCMAVVALIWQGWAYAPIILLVYVVLQLFVDRLRDHDPMGMGICFTITMSVALLLSAPWYVLYGQVKVWFDVPLVLFLAATVLGFVLTVTRNYPWALVIPSVLVAAGAILGVLVIVSPAVATAFVSGAGYFVRTKLYETIAEAQPPGLSQAILSFGAATYYFSLFGLFWMAVKLPKRPEPDYLFILTWTFAAIFMSMAAARFIFNAGPAFALTAGWVISILVDKVDFETMKRTFSSLAGGSKLTALKKSVKPRHVLGSLVIIFLLLLPNVWYGVDASIPYEQKAVYDRQIYYTLPDFLRPQGYTPPTGRSSNTFYFGAFGYSLPLPNSYFPAAWDWFSKQDSLVEMPEKRPAYLSWWDYGFEAVDRGEHPTVADNFQDGYQLAGQFITAQSEDQAIALLIIRLIEGDFYGNSRRLSSGVALALQSRGIDSAEVQKSFSNPSSLTSVVLGDPVKYGRWDSSMQPTNALYIYLSEYLDDLTTTDEMASLYHDIRAVTGWSIRYFGVDSRMFPADGGGNNIFYAPVKLSDHRVQNLPDGRVLPVDFFSIEVVTNKGTFPAALVPLGAQVQSYNIKYTDMFYSSMFYRAYMGFGPSDVGQTCESSDCLPGIRGELQSSMPMQAWNLSHFKVVYKTAYFNPWGVPDYQNHSEDWTAVNYFDALDLQRRINRNEIKGVVDFGNQTLVSSGVVFVKYYDGAYINGTVTVDGVIPLPGVRVTVQDYEDPANPTPHYSVITDKQGRYSLIAPFGTLRIVASTGTFNKRTMTGSTILDQEFIIVTDDQAMREPIDRDGNGLPDYLIKKDIVVSGVTVTGTAFVDSNNDGNFTVGEETMANAPVTLVHADLGLTRNLTTDGEGRFLLDHAYKGTYQATVSYHGRTNRAGAISVGEMDETLNLQANTTKLEGTVLVPGNIAVNGATVVAYDEAWGYSILTQSSGPGAFSMNLLPGNYTISATLGLNSSFPARFYIGSSASTTINLTMVPSGTVEGGTSLMGLVQPYVALEFQKVGSNPSTYSTTSDAAARYSVRLPVGIYNVHAKYYKSGILYASLERTVVVEGTKTEYDPNLSPGVMVQGVAYSVDKSRGAIGMLNVTFSNGDSSITIKTSKEGNYVVYLPQGDYSVQVSYFNLTYLREERFAASQTCDVSMGVGMRVLGEIYRDKNRNRMPDSGEEVADAQVTFTHSSGAVAEAFADANGFYELSLPNEGTYLMEVGHFGFQRLAFGPAPLGDFVANSTRSIIPLNVTISGRLLLHGKPLAVQSVGIQFRATGSGALSLSTSTDSYGKYATSIAPGEYDVKVDQAVDPGNDHVRYQDAYVERLSLGIGATSVTRDIPVSVRATVSGNVSLYGSPRNALVVFQGPESMNLTAANGTFSLMLSQGNYTIYANYSEGGISYAAFQKLVVMSPQSIEVALDRATIVQGSLLFRSLNLKEAAPIKFMNDQGVEFLTVANTEGFYSIGLVSGDYTVELRYRSNATVNGSKQHVLYAHTSSLHVAQGESILVHDLDLVLTLDNSTIRGRVLYNGAPSAAYMEFRPDGPGALNATLTASSDGMYEIGLSAGLYVVYVRDPVTHGVLLQPLEVQPYTATIMNMSLEKGFKLSGITTYLNSARVLTMMTITDPVVWIFYTDAKGYYEMYLPADTYEVRAIATVKEHGRNIGYNRTSTVELSADWVENYQLKRIMIYGVYLSEVKSKMEKNPPVARGGTTRRIITVWNCGNAWDTIRLEGTSADWEITFDRPTVSLDFGSMNGVYLNTTNVTAIFKAPLDANVDHPPVGVTGYSLNATFERYTLKVIVDVETVRGIGLRLADVNPVYEDRFLNYTLEIANTGNAVERVEISIDNPQGLEDLGWDASLSVNSSTPRKTVIDGIIVGANSTSRLSLVLENRGGLEGAGVVVVARLQNAPAYWSMLSVSTTMPRLQIEANVAVAGTAIQREAPLSPALVAIGGSLGFVAAMFLVFHLRDRRRRRKR